MTTWGELNEARDNAILITTRYLGTHQIRRDVYVGSDHASPCSPSRQRCVGREACHVLSFPANREGQDSRIVSVNPGYSHTLRYLWPNF